MGIDVVCAPQAMSAQGGKKGEAKATFKNKGERNRRSTSTAPGNASTSLVTQRRIFRRCERDQVSVF